MQYELILVFEHAHRNPQLDRNTRLALDIPTSMTLEEREHLFVVWNRLAEQYTAFDLSGLPAGVRQCLFDARACAESANLLAPIKMRQFIFTHTSWACPEARSARGRGVSNNARARQRPWISAVSARADSRAA